MPKPRPKLIRRTTTCEEEFLDHEEDLDVNEPLSDLDEDEDEDDGDDEDDEG